MIRPPDTFAWRVVAAAVFAGGVWLAGPLPAAAASALPRAPPVATALDLGIWIINSTDDETETFRI